MYRTAEALPKAELSGSRFKLGFGLKLLISIALLGLLFALVDLGAAFRALADPSVIPLAFAIIMAPLGQVISARKWQILAQAQHVVIGLKQSIRLYFIGSFASLYLPTNVGGDALRLYMARKFGPIEKVAASIITERMTGVAILLAFAFVGFLLATPLALAETGLVGAWIGAVCLIPLALVCLFRPLVIARCAEVVGFGIFGRFATKLVAQITNTATAMDGYRHQHDVIWKAMGWSLVFYVNLVLSQYMQLSIVGADVALSDVLIVAPLIPLISLLPISINAIGVAETAFVVGYVALGVAPELALAAALIRRAFYSIAVLPGLVFWIQGKDEAGPKELRPVEIDDETVPAILPTRPAN